MIFRPRSSIAHIYQAPSRYLNFGRFANCRSGLVFAPPVLRGGNSEGFSWHGWISHELFSAWCLLGWSNEYPGDGHVSWATNGKYKSYTSHWIYVCMVYSPTFIIYSWFLWSISRVNIPFPSHGSHHGNSSWTAVAAIFLLRALSLGTPGEKTVDGSEIR